MDFTEIFTNLVIQLATQYPIVFTIIAILGTFRLVMKPLMMGLKLIAAQTASAKDDELLVEVERSAFYKGLIFLLDWIASVKVPAKTISIVQAVPEAPKEIV